MNIYFCKNKHLAQMEKNKHGLTRDIPRDIKLKVRQKYGFGCVICGEAFIQYEHIDPEFKDCKEHTEEGITILCNTHHGMKTSRRLSKELVLKAMQNPKCLQQGFSNTHLFLSEKPTTVKLAGSFIYGSEHIIAINDEPIVSLSEPTDENDIYKLSALFQDKNDNQMLLIVENEIIMKIGTWDIEHVGPKIKIRNSKNDIGLILNIEQDNLISVERIKARYGNVTIEGNSQELIIMNADSQSKLAMYGTTLAHNTVGIAINSPNIRGAGCRI